VRDGWVYSFRDGDDWDCAITEAFRVHMRVTDKRKDLKGVKDAQLTCEPAYEQVEIPWAFSRLNKTGTMFSLIKRDLAK
jgi:hypothetical protein